MNQSMLEQRNHVLYNFKLIIQLLLNNDKLTYVLNDIYYLLNSIINSASLS